MFLLYGMLLKIVNFVSINYNSMITFSIDTEYIELIKLLKATQVAESGGMAKLMVENGEVIRNGEIEYRKRAKIIPGETIEVRGTTIRITV